MDEIGFNDLPLELTIKIFSYLDLHTVRCTLPRVCKSFREIVMQPTLWNSVYVSLHVQSQSCPKWEVLSEFLSSTPVQRLQLKRFNYQHFNSFDDSSHYSPNNVLSEGAILKKHVFKCSLHLKELSIVGFKNLSIVKFYNISPSRLTKLEITGIDSKTLRDILSTFPNLVELRILSFKGLITEDLINEMCGIRTLLLPINNCDISLLHHLKTLNLKRFSASDSEPNMSKLLAIIDLPLYQLELKEQFLAPYFPRSALATFFSSRTFSQLKYISLQYCRFCDKSAHFLRMNCQNLISLEVENATKENNEFLSQTGIKTLLHLQFLRLLKVSVMKKDSSEWHYKRSRWITIDCNCVETCPNSLDALLQGWQEIEIDVST